MVQKYGRFPNYIVILSQYLKMKMKKILIPTVFFSVCHLANAQGESSAMRVLSLPTTAHVVALGGENITAIDNQPGVGLHNPALLAGTDSRSAALQFMTYADGGKWMGAEYAMAFGERHTGAAYLHYMGYGEMEETDVSGTVIGTFAPKDAILGVGYSYLLSEHWAGGANFKAAYSRIADFSSASIAVDLGLNYYDSEKAVSLSMVMRNIGAQIKTYDGVVERVPYNLQLGLTKGLAHLPVEFNITLTDLTRWKKSDYVAIPDADKEQQSNEEDAALSTGRLMLNHLVFGVEVKPRENIWIAAGYNFRRGYELQAAGKGHLAGLSAGAGIKLQKFSIGLAWAKYHMAAQSLMGNVAVSF